MTRTQPQNTKVGILHCSRASPAGVKRVSFAASLYRAAITGLFNAVREIKGGTFNYLEQTIASAELAPFLQD